MSLATRALLVDLTQGMFGNEVKNRQLAQELADNHQADSNTLKVVEKLLGQMTEYDELKKSLLEVYRFHVNNTQPWEHGVRILASSRFPKYNEGIDQRINNVWQKHQKFVKAYKTMQDDNFEGERAARNGLFDVSQYPTSEYLNTRTRCAIVYSQVPDSGDFRVDLDEDSVKIITEQVQNREKMLQEQANRFTVDRIQKALERVKKVMSSSKPRIFKSLFEELQSAVEPLGDFAQLDDTGLLDSIQKKFGSKLNELANSDAEEFKGSGAASLRNATLKDADKLAKELAGMF